MYDVLQQRTMEVMNHKNSVVANFFNEIELRDLFAMSAMTGIISRQDIWGDPTVLASCAYRYADAMIEARKGE